MKKINQIPTFTINLFPDQKSPVSTRQSFAKNRKTPTASYSFFPKYLCSINRQTRGKAVTRHKILVGMDRLKAL